MARRRDRPRGSSGWTVCRAVRGPTSLTADPGRRSARVRRAGRVRNARSSRSTWSARRRPGRHAVPWPRRPGRAAGRPQRRRPPGDLRRNRLGVALVGDPRKDVLLLMSRAHAAVLHRHNRLVDHLRGDGRPTRRLRWPRLHRAATWPTWPCSADGLPPLAGAEMAAEYWAAGPGNYRPRQGADLGQAGGGRRRCWPGRRPEPDAAPAAGRPGPPRSSTHRYPGLHGGLPGPWPPAAGRTCTSTPPGRPRTCRPAVDLPPRGRPGPAARPCGGGSGDATPPWRAASCSAARVGRRRASLWPAASDRALAGRPASWPTGGWRHRSSSTCSRRPSPGRRRALARSAAPRRDVWPASSTPTARATGPSTPPGGPRSPPHRAGSAWPTCWPSAPWSPSGRWLGRRSRPDAVACSAWSNRQRPSMRPGRPGGRAGSSASTWPCSWSAGWPGWRRGRSPGGGCSPTPARPGSRASRRSRSTGPAGRPRSRSATCRPATTATCRSSRASPGCRPARQAAVCQAWAEAVRDRGAARSPRSASTRP